MADRSRGRGRAAAFFDMDKTLIAENSASLFFKRRFELGEISGLEVLKGIGAYLQYKLGVLDISSWTKDAMRQFEGQREAELAAMAEEWFGELVEPTIYPEAERIVREHQERGDLIVIVSGATKFVVSPLCRRLGIDHMLYTQLEVEEGLFTGEVIEPVCFEDGKIYWVLQFMEHEEIDLARSWFYTDSVTDLPLLDLVGHPVCVNPDPRLYREAARRHWPVRLFDPPESLRPPSAVGV